MMLSNLIGCLLRIFADDASHEYKRGSCHSLVTMVNVRVADFSRHSVLNHMYIVSNTMYLSTLASIHSMEDVNDKRKQRLLRYLSVIDNWYV